VVSFAGPAGNYGLLVALDHGNGVQTRYAHLSRLGVRRGQRVASGDILGSVGSTGRSTGPHLHYEVRSQGYAINPLGN
jgi:murein DD-endopeptidase MepM/ murein hydrolase activator NlpD